MNLFSLVILLFSFFVLYGYANLTSSVDPKSSSSWKREDFTVEELPIRNQKIIAKNLFINGIPTKKVAIMATRRILESSSKELVGKNAPPGFWKNPSQTQTYYCFNNPESCLGEKNCQEGYSGTLCNECLPQHSNLLKNKCNQCGFPSFFAIINELFLIITPVFLMWCILMIIMDSRNSLDIGRGDSTKRQKLCMLVNNIISYLQDLYLLSIVAPNLPTSLLYLSQPIANSSFNLFGLMNCFSDQNSDVALRYIVSFGINFALILILMKIFFSLGFIKKNISIIVLCVFILQNLGIVDFALSLLTCREIEGKYLSIYNMSIECQEASLAARNIVLLSIFILSAIIVPWMIIQGVLKRQIQNEEAQTRIKLTLFGTEEELQAQSHITSSWLFVYFNNFGKQILLFLSIMLKSTPTRSPMNLFADVVFALYYFGFFLLKLKRNIAFLKSWQSRLILMRPGIILLSFLTGSLLLASNWPFINSGIKLIVSLLHLTYFAFLITVTGMETWKNAEVFNFAQKTVSRVELQNYFHHHVPLAEEEDDDGFGEYQSDVTHEIGEMKKEEHLNSDDSEEPELNDEMIAKEEMRGLCDDEDQD